MKGSKNNTVHFGKSAAMDGGELSILPAEESRQFYNALYKDIHNYPPLSREEEQSLFTQYRESKDEKEKMQLRDKIVLHNLRCVVAISKQSYDKRYQFMDLISEGIYGLIQSVDKYDISRGTRFYTFASHYILKYIKEFKHSNSGAVTYIFPRYRAIYRLFMRFLFDVYYQEVDASSSTNSLFKNPICSTIERFDTIYAMFAEHHNTIDTLPYKLLIYQAIRNECSGDNSWQYYIPQDTGSTLNTTIRIEEDASFSDGFSPEGESTLEEDVHKSLMTKEIDHIESIRLLLFKKLFKCYHYCSAIFIFHKYKISVRYLSFMKAEIVPEEVKDILQKVHNQMMEKEPDNLPSLYTDSIPYLYRYIRKGCDAKKAMQVIGELRHDPVIIKLLKSALNYL